MWWPLVLFPAVAGVARLPAPVSPAVWIALDGHDPNLQQQVEHHVREARTDGMLPIIHWRTGWNAATTLRKHASHPRVRRALQGVTVIEVEIDRGWLSTWPALDALHCNPMFQMFVAVTEHGQPGAPMATPGTKFGPQEPEEHAAFLESYLSRLQAEAPPTVIDRPTSEYCDRSVVFGWDATVSSP